MNENPNMLDRRKMSDGALIGAVARREFVTQVRRPEFWGSLIIMALVVFASIGAQALFSGNQSQPRVDVSSSQPDMLAALRTSDAVTVVEVDSDGQARAAVTDESADAAILADGSAVYLDRVDEGLDSALRKAHSDVAVTTALRVSGATDEQVSEALNPEPLAVTMLDPDADRKTQRTFIALIAIVSIFFLMFSFGQTIAQGVLEEKSSRIVEILLAKVRSWHLLSGKVLGLGAVVLTQITVLMLGGVTAAAAADLIDVPADAVSVGLLVLAWFIPGYFLFATMWAVAGALVSRPEDLSNAAGPVSLLMTMGLLGALFPFTGVAPALSATLSMVPGFSWSMMPVRMARDQVPGWQIVVALVAMAAAIMVLVRIGGRVYVGGLLENGGLLKARAAFRRAKESGVA